MNDAGWTFICLLVLEIFQVIAFGLVLNRAIMKNASKITENALASIDLFKLLVPLFEEGKDGDARRALMKEFCRRCGTEAFAGGLEYIQQMQTVPSQPGTGGNAVSPISADLPPIPGLPDWIPAALKYLPLLQSFGRPAGQQAQLPQGSTAKGDWHG